MSYEINPLIIIAAIGAALAILSGFFIIRSKATKVRIGLSILALALLMPSFLVVAVFYPWLYDARFRTYRSFYKDIKIGMTRDQVMEVAYIHYPEGGTRGFPKVMREDENNLGFFMNPEESSEPNCEGIFLQFRDGKVVRVHYSAD